jgi:hypothetical protein
MLEPTGGFKELYYFIDNPSNTIKSFDQLQDGVTALDIKSGTYFCGPREYNINIKKYE